MKFSDELIAGINKTWRANHSHPFVQGIGHGTLEPGKFKYYLIQDYLYLIQYAKVYALGIQKASDLSTMTELSNSVNYILAGEMALHRQYAERFGVTAQDFEEAIEAPTTIAYTRYMLAEAQNGSLAHVIAAVLPCAISYAEIGAELAAIPGSLEHPLYGDWIRTYSSDDFAKSVQATVDLMDRLAIDLQGVERDKLKEIFLTTTRFEYLFWDMGNDVVDWPQNLLDAVTETV
ncbi:thiaminase II [Kurthia sibirica]|uniref:Aminopyrimidine aminohydrolase n=1 Tax=Kurthia sibirica TaxID=202750 RepID=A0A2U3AP21_9BACL|nr:thiaminase II [Kurthia sibirica]PWI26300.1 thiaminase II [Kurthia sibirica]GEK35031.1 aminopyrimidine aminohydrolase [Kurthia sibirica]